MAIYHLSMSAVQRSAGRSAAASAAYRSGEEIPDPRQGKTWAYTNRSDRIIETQLILPLGSKPITRAELWSAVEIHHKRKDACTAREVEVALPHDLPVDQAKKLAYALATEIAMTYGVAADVAIHRSDKGENLHAHILTTSASYGPDGLGARANSWDPQMAKRAGGIVPADYLRPVWANLVNRALPAHVARIDHRTLEAQGIDRPAQIHVGPRAFKGHRDRAEENARIKETNQNISEIKKKIRTQETYLWNELEGERYRNELAEQERIKAEAKAKRAEEKARVKAETEAVKRPEFKAEPEEAPVPPPSPEKIQETPKEDTMQATITQTQRGELKVELRSDDGEELAGGSWLPSQENEAYDWIEAEAEIDQTPAKIEMRPFEMSPGGLVQLARMARELGVADDPQKPLTTAGLIWEATMYPGGKTRLDPPASPEDSWAIIDQAEIMAQVEASRGSQRPQEPQKRDFPGRDR